MKPAKLIVLDVEALRRRIPNMVPDSHHPIVVARSDGPIDLTAGKDVLGEFARLWSAPKRKAG